MGSQVFWSRPKLSEIDQNKSILTRKVIVEREPNAGDDGDGGDDDHHEYGDDENKRRMLVT